ncbi:MAG: ATP-binding protein [Christensenellaceae bacterium]|jgi:signal transduction histidine kinase
MQELSLNILDITQNSLRAGATKIEIVIDENTKSDSLSVIIRDNGSGMSEAQVKSVTDPFFTTRNTRKVGLGIPFYKMAAEMTGGSFEIRSTLGVGTEVIAVFIRSHIDRMPLGNIAETISQLICLNEETMITYTQRFDQDSFTVTTKMFSDTLDGIPLSTPQVMQFVYDYIAQYVDALYEQDNIESINMEEI